jgi:hypothetical protein
MSVTSIDRRQQCRFRVLRHERVSTTPVLRPGGLGCGTGRQRGYGRLRIPDPPARCSLTPSSSELDEHKWSGTRREKARAQAVLKRLDALDLSRTPVTPAGREVIALESEPEDGLFVQHRFSAQVVDDRLIRVGAGVQGNRCQRTLHRPHRRHGPAREIAQPPAGIHSASGGFAEPGGPGPRATIYRRSGSGCSGSSPRLGGTARRLTAVIFRCRPREAPTAQRERGGERSGWPCQPSLPAC